ncbi:CYCLIC NUCLEOTIDE-GATED CHANNEL 20, cyclic nucleotide gated channel 20 [Hibiscus trionum]|uniref:CYCLIC NUCLEOTIDE-GATED CHANNEL 20, cyclic nucleotide gated channel 20 n=1 Tax=Hibiscus trionum TaxID=183268 RepID=A0A9W7MFX3_HIBTR|nr:CYCLIC NUCLEOTIDE-GATED CHANNEL 20, cyclic nucleotide gated channel 20 [Hibiscus trionum]
MASYDKDEVPMLSDTYPQSSANNQDSQFQTSISWTRSASISIPMNSMESYQNANLVGHTGPLRNERKTPFTQMSGPLYINRRPENSFQLNQSTASRKTGEPKAEKFPSFNGMDEKDWSDNNYAGKNEHLLRSGQLGMCNDPYCTTCPTYYNFRLEQQKKVSGIFDTKFHNALYGDAKGWARKLVSCLRSYVPGIMNPHAKVVQHWNKFFVISCLMAVFIDPLFFILLSVQKENKCIVIDWPATKVFVAFRSVTDFIYLLNMLLQFRLAYIAPESRVVGAGELVDHPTKIAFNYLGGYFFLDFFVVLPLPQIMILLVLPKHLGSSGANFAKNLLRTAILIQYLPRLYRFLPFLAGQSPLGFIFESAWANFVINLLTFILSGHVVGSCWYLFGLQRVNQCLRNACRNSNITNCMELIDCGSGRTFNNPFWMNNANVSACFTEDGFDYGIYVHAVNLTTEDSIVTRYVYSLFWGFQQISTLAGNQTPSYFVWEVLFTMAIVGLGLLLFALLIGNMQNFLLALGRRRLEMSLRRRDVEQWMSHRRLPVELRRKVREAERYNWAATRGVNEEMLVENLPEDLQREIRRHLFKFVKKVRIFALMDDTILDAICERLRQKIYIKGSNVLSRGGLIEKMVFIVRGKMVSIGENGIEVALSEGDVCGEELLTWCLEHSSVNRDVKKIRIPGQRLLSNRQVRCLTNVEAFSLRAADLEEVTSLFSRFLRNPRVQGAIRYESPYWRSVAATRIQVAWRYRKKRLNRADTSQSVYYSG